MSRPPKQGDQKKVVSENKDRNYFYIEKFNKLQYADDTIIYKALRLRGIV